MEKKKDDFLEMGEGGIGPERIIGEMIIHLFFNLHTLTHSRKRVEGRLKKKRGNLYTVYDYSLY